MPPYSQLVVHGEGPAYYDARNVPHGTVTRHVYHSDVTGGERELYVYAPPGYDPARTYPVLYLLGGSGDPRAGLGDIGIGGAVRLMMQVVELGDRRVARGKHFTIGLARNRRQRGGIDPGREAGLTDVGIEEAQGFLSDHYDPRSKTLRLSPDVYDGRSVASVAVAASSQLCRMLRRPLATNKRP